jgi:hypothetical protein
MNSGDVSNTTTTNSGEFLARGGGGDGDTIITDGVIGDSGCSPTLGGTSSDTRGGKPSGIGLRPIGQGGILTVAGGDVLGAPVAATKYGRAVAQTEVDTKGDSRWLADNESLVVTAFVAWVPVIKAQKFLVPVWPAQAARFSMTGWLSMCPYATPSTTAGPYGVSWAWGQMASSRDSCYKWSRPLRQAQGPGWSAYGPCASAQRRE